MKAGKHHWSRAHVTPVRIALAVVYVVAAFTVYADLFIWRINP